jgi:trimeric autotransporter adhesin
MKIAMKLTARQSTASFGPSVPSTWRLQRRALPSVVFLVLVFLVSAAPAFAGPSIAVMTPQTGPAGTLVVIIGSGFGASQGASTVTFNGTPVTWVSWGSTTLSVQVPAGATSGNVAVKVAGVSSSGKSFTVSLSPVITGVSPTSGLVGATLTITGRNFTAGGTQTPQVVFNPELYASPASSTDTSITVAVPAGATTGDLVVSVGGGNSNAVLFTVTSSDPSISNISPGGGVVGTAVTITGANFGSSRGTSTVTFNGTAGTPTNWSGTSITVPVPTGATTGNVLVTVSGVASDPFGFEVGTAAPNITSISPTSGAVATSVTIKGTGFGSTQGTNTVTFNGVSSVPTSWSATQIKAPVPTGATSGSVVVTASGTVSNSVTFTVPGTGPSITGLSPSSGPVAASVTITGTNFDATQSTSTVTFNGVPATATGWSPTSIVATVPSGATSGTVVVTVSGTASGGFSFSVAPNITNLSPATGAVGATVTISGTSFGSTQGTSTVSFNGTAATPTSWSASSITVPVPSGATSGNVVVTVGGVASNGVNFSVAPNITSLSPTSGGVGTLVTISGTSFGSSQGTSTVSFNGTAAAPTSWGSGSIIVLVPSGATAGNVVVTVGGAVSNGIGFTVQSGAFVATSGQMEASRYGQTATQLTTGQVLIAGGMGSSGVANSAELYTLASRTFGAAPNTMNIARWLHTATVLNDGTVLIAGGSSVSSEATLNSAEIYDPVAGTFTLLPNTLNTARGGHTATLLSNGQVLIVGGYDPTTGIISDAELYDPTAQVFIDLGNTNSPRFHHTTTLLQNGQVLIAGGETDPTPTGAYNTAEIFNPTTWTFTALTVNMTVAREGHVATLLNNGQVLITGGDLPGTGSLNTAETYNPAANTFKAVSSTMTTPRIYHEAVLLNGGTVLLSGGENDSGGNSTALNTAEIYDPSALTFTAVAGNMTSPREHQTATLLNDGTVLEDGGADGTNIFNTAEIYTVSKLTGLSSIAISPAVPSVPVGTQQLLVATGTFSGGSTQVLSSVLWSSSSPSVSTVTNDASDTGFASSVAQGTATITATAAGVSGSTTITAPAPALVSITLSSSGLTLPLGTTQQFSATGTYSDGSSQDLTSTATWTSSSASATVSSSGLVTGVSPGNSTIQASSGSQSGSATVTVGAPALVALSLTPSSATIALGTTQQYQVIGTYTDGSTQNLTASATWVVVPLTTASITSSGLAAGIGQGTATVGVTTGGFDTIATLAVGAPSLVSIAVVPNATNVPVGSSQQFTATASYTDGSARDITSSVSWASSNQTAVSISSSGLASAVAGGNSTITAASGAVSGTAALTVGAGAAGLNTGRYQHGATLLNNGTVLISGGVNCPSSGTCTYLNSAELYTPSTATFATTGSMSAARSAPAILLGNGKVLVAGGYSCDSNGNCASLKSAEIYNPVSGTFSSAGNMTVDRYGHTMTLMSSGQVLIAGGETCSSATSCSALSAAEIYDPVAGIFTATGNLNAARFNASAVALNNGLVLIAGGFNGTTYPATGELYDPVAATFSNTSTNLNTLRANATATLLDNSEVLIAGGSTCSTPSCPTSVAELYDNGSFYYFSYPTSNMVVSRWDQTATLLTNGEVLLAGGYDSCAPSCISDGTTELFNPQGESFDSSQALSTGRSGHTATLLTDGSVLVVGGINNGVTLSSTDSYQPSSLALPQLAVITIAPSNQPMVLGTTLPLVATGMDAYGDNLGTLQSVTWNSSSPGVASISNAAGSAGIVNSLSVGTTTITASIGTVSVSTQVTVTAPLVSIALSPSNPTITTNSPQELQLTAIGIYSDGSTLNLSANVTWSTSNASVALVIPNSADPGIVAPVAVGTANIRATLGSISGSTPVTVTTPSVPVAPTVASVSPTNGSAGTQVSITGSGFGSSQGTGMIVLGTTLGTVVSWSDTQVVATVNTGSMSGVAEIEQGGLASNSVTFTVNTASITNVSPTSGLPGTQVTITGSGFGATQGTGNVWLGTAAGVVDSWSDGQVVATVPSGSTSGNAQILQNGVLSNAVAFTIDSLQISSITPTSGGAGTVVTINGGGFGSSQGSGNVWIGNTYGVVTGWSDTQVVASVGSSAVSGVVKVEQNGNWSNAVTFTVPPSVGSTTPVTVVPNIISMVVGGTQSIQALDASGNSVTGLTWTSSNPALATLSADDPPIITAIATGNVTITAGDASADLTIYVGPTLPLGTIQWSNPGDGSGVSKIMPAVPSSTGVADVFAVQQSGNVQAIRADGTTAWTANASVSLSSTMLPDFQGGLVVVGSTVQRYDGLTGQPSQLYAYTNPYNPAGGPTPALVHPDGSFLTLDNNSIKIISPSGFSDPPLDQSSSYDDGDCGEFNPRTLTSPASVGQGIIAGDGYAYFPYFYTISSDTNICTEPNAAIGHNETHLRIMKVGTDGFSQEIKVGDWVQDSVTSLATSTTGSAAPGNLLGTLITNADQGVLFSWGGNQLTTVDTSGHPTTATLNLGSGASFGVQPVLQRADGTYVGTVVAETNGFPLHSMIAFTLSGQLLWRQPNYVPQIATSGGGTIATSLDGTTIATFDTSGNQTGKLASMPTRSWTGGAYKLGSVESFYALLAKLEDGSYSAFQGGNASNNGTAIKQQWFPPLADCLNGSTASCIGPKQAIYNALDDLIARLPGVSALAQTKIFNLLGNDANGNKLTTQSFLSYLISQRPRFYDGTLSTYCLGALSGSVVCKYPPVSWIAPSVADDFQSHPGTSADTGTPSYPLLTFFRPTSILYDNLGRNGSNEATIFHEALHGITGLLDRGTLTNPSGILEKLNSNSGDASCVITFIVWHDVLSASPGLSTAPSCP